MSEIHSGKSGHLSVLRIAWVAHNNVDRSVKGKEAEEFLLHLLPRDVFEIVDSHPDVILFMTGGSERNAIKLIEPGNPVLLLSIRAINSYPAATEVMAWAINNNIFAILSDGLEALESGLLERWRKTCSVWRSFSGKRAGLIGSVSEWLVASGTPPERFGRLFDAALINIPWDSVPDYSGREPDNILFSRFKESGFRGLDDSARVLTALREVINDYELSAVAVECFSLVQERGVTACLALALLNAEGTVAACEGDLASMAGMMLVSQAAGTMPWMANTTRITKNSLLLTHCTISLDLVTDIRLDTHYETDCSVAVKGRISAREVTIFRFSENLDRAFVAEGIITGIPDLKTACRTQAEIELSPAALETLRTHPLGNHLLLVPGRHAGLLSLACRYKNISILS